MAGFDKKIFNAEVFGKYVDTVPRVKQDQFLKAGDSLSRLTTIEASLSIPPLTMAMRL